MGAFLLPHSRFLLICLNSVKYLKSSRHPGSDALLGSGDKKNLTGLDLIGVGNVVELLKSRDCSVETDGDAAEGISVYYGVSEVRTACAAADFVHFVLTEYCHNFILLKRFDLFIVLKPCFTAKYVNKKVMLQLFENFLFWADFNCNCFMK